MRTDQLLLFIALSIIVAGCLQNVQGSGQYTDEYVQEFRPLAISDPAEIENCEMGNCWCMICENGSGWWGFRRSLVGGHCFFEKECTSQVFDEMNAGTYDPSGTSEPGSSFRLWHFMIGQGPSFADFGDANGYCNDKLSMAVQWLLGDAETPYDKPDAGRAVCLLDKEVMPVYVLYSNGENIDLDRSEEIGQILATQGDRYTDFTTGRVGPVIITTEIDFNYSDVDRIIAQIEAINRGCRNDRTSDELNCMVAVAPKMGDTASLDAVLDQANSSVDLVAFGINGHTVNIQSACGSPGSEIMTQAREFAGYALYTWDKPSVIPYVMFDSAGTDVDASCEWSEYKMTTAYSRFFPYGVMTLQKKGVIGVAPYSFNSTTVGAVNPLNCNNCGLGATEARLRSWFGGCQAFTAVAQKTAGGGREAAYQIPGNLLVIPSRQGSSCDYNSDATAMLRNVQFGYSILNKDFFNPQQPPLLETTDEYQSKIRCDACLTQELANPYPILEQGGLFRESYCTDYEEVEYWASRRSIDPMLVRAFMVTESGFDECAVAIVSQSGPGFAEAGEWGFAGTYAQGFDYMVDPRKEAGLAEFCDLPDELPDDEGGDTQIRFNGLGLMQVIVGPTTFWNGTHHPSGEDGRHASRQNSRLTPEGFYPAALSCSQEFNPFNSTHNICMGTFIMREALDDARSWVSTHMGAQTEGRVDDSTNVLIGYVAAHMYLGDWTGNNFAQEDVFCRGGSYAGSNSACWLYGSGLSRNVNQAFCEEQWDEEEEETDQCKGDGEPNNEYPFCYGYSDLISFISCKIGDKDTALQKMQTYYRLRDGCEASHCPDWKHLNAAIGDRALTERDPPIRNPYAEDGGIQD